MNITIIKNSLYKAFDEGAESPYEFREEIVESLLKEIEQQIYKKDVSITLQESTCKVDEYGTKRWYNKQGQLHRSTGPALECANGHKKWYQNDKCHRLYGPAIEKANGTKKWYQNGKLHRLDGPAIEYSDGDKAYFVEGKSYSEEDFTKFFGEV